MVRAPFVIAALLALAFPAGALARKNAWQLGALSGTYEYHATAAPGSNVTSKASKRRFTRRWAKFSVRGSGSVQHESSFTATASYSATATLKKVVIRTAAWT